MQHLNHITKLETEINWTLTEKTCLSGFANNTGADQPAHSCRLISAFVIHLSRSIISTRRLGMSKISIFWLVSVAEETGLKLVMSETLKTDFVATRPNL